MNYRIRIKKIFHLTLFSFILYFFRTSVGFAVLPLDFPLFSGQAYPTESSPTSIAIEDLDGDGKLDLVVANYDSNSISVLLGNGDGTFKKKTDYAVGINPSSVAIGHLDEDDKLDIVVTNSGTDSNSFTILFGRGDGTFEDSRSITGLQQPSSVAIGEFNNDGRFDLAIANEGDNSVLIYFGQNDGTFINTGKLFTEKRPSFIITKDLNGDRKIDLAVTNYDSNSVSIFMGDGKGGFQLKGNYPTTSGPLSIAVQDFNRDGKLDLAVVGKGSLLQNASILLGNGDGTFQPKKEQQIGEQFSSIVVGNFNGDSIPDLALANQDNALIFILIGKGDGTFTVNNTYPTELKPSSIAVADLVGDFNGDGKSDLIVANSGDKTISILLGNGEGSFAKPNPSYLTESFPKSVTVGDFNGDKIPDIATANRGGNSVSVLVGNGGGTFQPKGNYKVGSEPSFVTVGDFNNDNKLDLVVANNRSGSVSILLGNGDGNFQPKIDYMVGSQASSVAIGDFNGDGKLDLAVTNSADSVVSILIGNGDGSFQPKIDDPVVGAGSITVGDFNEDKKLDLAVVNRFIGKGSISILLGNGDGTFKEKVDYTIIKSPESITIKDFNEDGKLDLAVVNYDGNAVSILLGNGDGTFKDHVDYVTGRGSRAVTAEEHPQSIVSGDFNGDKRVDLAILNRWSNSISVLIGNGNGGFQFNLSYLTGGREVSSITTGDFNKDKKLDLAVTNFAFNSVSILQNLRPYVPGSLQWSSGLYTAKKSDSSVIITISRINGDEGSTSVNYNTTDGTAIAGKDYTATSGTLSWEDGDTTDKTVTIPLLNNGSVDTDKTLRLTLSNPTNGAALGPQTTAAVLIPKTDISGGDNPSGGSGSGGCQLNPLDIGSQNFKASYIFLLMSISLIFLRRKNLKN